jgi:hypothetical protein
VGGSRDQQSADEEWSMVWTYQLVRAGEARFEFFIENTWVHHFADAPAAAWSLAHRRGARMV